MSYWLVVPAAGVGSRMGGTTPKQYLELAGRKLIEHVLERVAAHPLLSGTVVSIAPADPWWRDIDLGRWPSLTTAAGGAERCHSVSNALAELSGRAGEEDWVLVHDAARPCVRRADIDRLVRTLDTDPVGGLLGMPVADTLKLADHEGRVRRTVDRNGLWRALTPQMFRLGLLRDALAEAIGAGSLVTDEAQAMELAGHRPRVVEGHGDNIKVTRPEDLALAELYLRAQEES